MNQLLSIAIPTHKRPAELAETLNAFLPQVSPHEIPICISFSEDGGQTEAVIERFRSSYPHVRSVCDPSATNIDRKMVSVVALARTRYVWLFGDDDLPQPGAIDRLLSCFHERAWGLIVVNASTHDAAFHRTVEHRRLRSERDREYAPGEHERLLRDTAALATSLSVLVFDKAIWDGLDPAPFFDTDYLHVAVLYRGVVGRDARFVADPQLRIRLGGATWASRYFEVELINWPKTIWEMPSDRYSDAAKRAVCARRPLVSLARLLATRAYGYYGEEQFHRFIASDRTIPGWRRALLRAPLMIPTGVAALALSWLRRLQALFGGAKAEITQFRLRGDSGSVVDGQR